VREWTKEERRKAQSLIVVIGELWTAAIIDDVMVSQSQSFLSTIPSTPFPPLPPQNGLLPLLSHQCLINNKNSPSDWQWITICQDSTADDESHVQSPGEAEAAGEA
jgi:hypothetical protein